MVILLNIFGLCGFLMCGFGIALLAGVAGYFGQPIGIIVTGFGSLIMIGGFSSSYAIKQLLAIKALLQQQRF